ncbi:hypothetical protein JB92DRAFT_3123996 [Gautieria morchelliformis]|nr:hypothetical protein JB92DRAFT_3123996 [Gautieria morchelliformis]
MPNVFHFLLDKSIKFHALHKELFPLTNTPAVDPFGQLSELKISSSTLAADSPGKLPSSSSVSSIDRSNQVSASPSGLELDRPNLLPPPPAREIGFPNQSPSPCTSVTPRSRCILHLVAITFWTWGHHCQSSDGVRGVCALSGTSGMCPPLKAVAAGMLNILTIVDTYLQNKQGFQDLAQKLNVLISIVKD